MEFSHMIISFLLLMAFVCGILIFVLKVVVFSSTENAVKRLEEDINKANAKHTELNQKLKEADEELQRRKDEAKRLAEKMRADAEEESKTEREKIVSNARKEGEEIIAKAQMSKDKLKEELEKELEFKVLKMSMELLNKVLSLKAKGLFNELLIKEFLESLKEIDMSRISPDIKSIQIVTLNSLDASLKDEFVKTIQTKLNRDITVETTTDPNLGGGVVLKFGSMALDGSLRNLIREAGTEFHKTVEA